MDSRYKHKIGQEVANSAPTPVNPTDIANKQYVDDTAGGGTSNTAAGAFTGVFDVSGGNKYYDDYTSGSVVNLSLSAAKVLGATATVRIKGDLTGTIPSEWSLSGQSLNTLPEKLNELTVLYVNSNDIRIVNRVVNNPTYVAYLSYENVTFATDAESGTLNTPTGGSGWTSWGYASKAINGNNAVHAIGNTDSLQMLGITNTEPTFSSSGGLTFMDLSSVDIFVHIKGTTDEIAVLENGSNVGTFAWSPGVPVYLRLTDGVVTVEHNGSAVYTSGLTYTLPLTPIALLHGDYPSAEIGNATFENTTNLETSPF